MYHLVQKLSPDQTTSRSDKTEGQPASSLVDKNTTCDAMVVCYFPTLSGV